jgi:hypothetical protein
VQCSEGRTKGPHTEWLGWRLTDGHGLLAVLFRYPQQMMYNPNQYFNHYPHQQVCAQTYLGRPEETLRPTLRHSLRRAVPLCRCAADWVPQ